MVSYGLDDQGVVVRCPTFQSYFVSFATSKSAQGPTQPPVQKVTRSDRKHGHSPPSSVEVKDERSCISALQICFYGADWQNFTFYEF